MLGLTRRKITDRQTIIALRATHTAHRVATAVKHPELPAQPRPMRKIFGETRIVDYDPMPQVVQYGREPEFSTWHYWLFVAMLLLAIIVPFLIAAF